MTSSRVFEDCQLLRQVVCRRPTTRVYFETSDRRFLAPFITEFFNRSPLADQFPAYFREAYITPIVKMPGLDAADVQYIIYLFVETA